MGQCYPNVESREMFSGGDLRTKEAIVQVQEDRLLHSLGWGTEFTSPRQRSGSGKAIEASEL